jgi:hypothetical protein
METRYWFGTACIESFTLVGGARLDLSSSRPESARTAEVVPRADFLGGPMGESIVTGLRARVAEHLLAREPLFRTYLLAKTGTLALCYPSSNGSAP